MRLFNASFELSFSPSVSPSVGVEQRDYRWTVFREILYSRFLVNSFANTETCKKFDKSNKQYRVFQKQLYNFENV